MKRLFIAAVSSILPIFIIAGCNSGTSAPLPPQAVNSASIPAQTPKTIPENAVPAAKKTLQAFRSEAELKAYFRQIAEARKKREEEERKKREEEERKAGHKKSVI